MFLSFDLLLAFTLFAFVTSITPGPNNMMLLASGVNFGASATVCTCPAAVVSAGRSPFATTTPFFYTTQSKVKPDRSIKS